MKTKLQQQKMRTILQGLLDSAKSEAGDVLTDPTWNKDYLFGFKLTVSDLREIDRYLTATQPANHS
jgi:soluble cytochrome b562